MNASIEKKLLAIAGEIIKENDPSHDINHTKRVLSLAKKIAKAEKANLNIIVPAAIFHDAICYQKNHPKSKDSARESADFALKILDQFDFSKEVISKVYASIDGCSFSKGVKAEFVEAKIIQDADRLEATGAISIMRTFASAGAMNTTFYNPHDPFCTNRKPEDLKYALDLVFTRLLEVSKKFHTQTAKKMAKSRHRFLQIFLKQLKTEIEL